MYRLATTHFVKLSQTERRHYYHNSRSCSTIG